MRIEPRNSNEHMNIVTWGNPEWWSSQDETCRTTRTTASSIPKWCGGTFPNQNHRHHPYIRNDDDDFDRRIHVEGRYNKYIVRMIMGLESEKATTILSVTIAVVVLVVRVGLVVVVESHVTTGTRLW